MTLQDVLFLNSRHPNIKSAQISNNYIFIDGFIYKINPFKRLNNNFIKFIGEDIKIFENFGIITGTSLLETYVDKWVDDEGQDCISKYDKPIKIKKIITFNYNLGKTLIGCPKFLPEWGVFIIGDNIFNENGKINNHQIIVKNGHGLRIDDKRGVYLVHQKKGFKSLHYLSNGEMVLDNLGGGWDNDEDRPSEVIINDFNVCWNYHNILGIKKIKSSSFIPPKSTPLALKPDIFSKIKEDAFNCYQQENFLYRFTYKCLGIMNFHQTSVSAAINSVNYAKKEIFDFLQSRNNLGLSEKETFIIKSQMKLIEVASDKIIDIKNKELENQRKEKEQKEIIFQQIKKAMELDKLKKEEEEKAIREQQYKQSIEYKMGNLESLKQQFKKLK